jgi:predicted SnoaL-like aldol condensation-catalyzing enzyme
MPYPRIIALVTLLALAACAGEPAPPPEPEQEQVSQEEQDRLQEQANVELVSEWWRTVLIAGHSELADQYMAEDYIQHNPNIDTSRAGLLAAPFMQREPGDIPEAIVPAPVVQFAKGDYVVFVWEREGTDPNDETQTYLYNFFDIVRVENGLIQEHWDSVYKSSTEPVVAGIGPRPVSLPNTPAEQANEDLAKIEFKDILQYQHLELAEEVMAPGYIQHNPNVPTGRDAFVEFFGQFAQPEPIMDAWKDEPELTLTSDDIVLYMFKRFSEDPADPAQVYKWNWFDMVRVSDGLVQEHWDMATKVPPPDSVPMPAGFVEYR